MDIRNSAELDLHLTGVILAESNEHNQINQTYSFGDIICETIIQRQVQVMEQVCSEVIVVTSTPRLFLPIVNRSVRIITNLFPDKGWFGGMYSALYLSKNRDVWIAGSNMPFVSPLAAQLLLQRKRSTDSQAVIPYVQGRAHPLHGIYDKSCSSVVSALVPKATCSIHDLLELITLQYVEEGEFKAQGVDMRFVQSFVPSQVNA